MHTFDDPKELIRWADENVDQLQGIMDRLFGQKNLTRVSDIDPETGHKLHKFRFEGQLPANTNRLISEVIVHSRHSLDQALCAAWSAAGLGEAPNNLYFPFPRNSDDLEGRLRAEPLSKIPATHEAIRRAAPYYTPQGATQGNELLFALNSAAKGKHRIIAKVAGTVHGTSIANGVVRGLVGSLRIPPVWDIEKGEILLGATRPDGDIQMEVRISLDVILQDAGELTGASIFDVLRTITAMCGEIIADIEARSSIGK